ncbi:MAG: phosphoglucosamine mutase, partial [Chromatiaceae bacterium]|nr:phosphoglucosamine mutase [Chromatiaceae bacterium]
KKKAHLGIAFDGDGDRVLMLDAQGRLVDGDQLIFIIAKERQSRGALGGDVVGTLMSNLGFEHALRRLGIGFSRTRVGDRYIMERLKQDGGLLGGEPSGHIICRDRTTTGDGIVAALQVLEALVESGRPIEELVAEVELYPQILINVRLDEQREIVGLPEMQAAVAAAEKELAGQGRILLRPSGTEPLIRVMVEGDDPVKVETIAQRLADLVRELI